MSVKTSAARRGGDEAPGKGRAHTELRRQSDVAPEAREAERAAAVEAAPVEEARTARDAPHLKPRTPPERLPEAGEDDGLDDLFNDMPV